MNRLPYRNAVARQCKTTGVPYRSIHTQRTSFMDLARMRLAVIVVISDAPPPDWIDRLSKELSTPNEYRVLIRWMQEVTPTFMRGH